jgi:hypothetical protein
VNHEPGADRKAVVAFGGAPLEAAQRGMFGCAAPPRRADGRLSPRCACG